MSAVTGPKAEASAKEDLNVCHMMMEAAEARLLSVAKDLSEANALAAKRQDQVKELSAKVDILSGTASTHAKELEAAKSLVKKNDEDLEALKLSIKERGTEQAAFKRSMLVGGLVGTSAAVLTYILGTRGGK